MSECITEEEFKCLCEKIKNGCERSLAELIVFANQGHSNSQWYLGWLYANGVVFNHSENKADYWFRLALSEK